MKAVTKISYSANCFYFKLRLGFFKIYVIIMHHREKMSAQSSNKESKTKSVDSNF